MTSYIEHVYRYHIRMHPLKVVLGCVLSGHLERSTTQCVSPFLFLLLSAMSYLQMLSLAAFWHVDSYGEAYYHE